MRRFALLLSALLILALTACGRDPGGAGGVDGRLEVSPLKTGPAVAELFLSREGRPVEGARLELEANMNHAGMVPVLATLSEGGQGIYRAELRFTMGGDWFIEVRGELADKTPYRQVFPIPAVEP